MMTIFDSHAHYDSDAFAADRDRLLAALPPKGVCGVINCADTLASAARSAKLCEKYPFMYMAAGVHPENAAHV
ncbi:MAG: TatD family hydrolase, partial [Clostridia bacterium]|nr:TatD family hydrolase [Clostridia bacterium]